VTVNPPFDRSLVEAYVDQGFDHIIMRYVSPDFDLDAVHALVAWRNELTG
jgi:hypothetical protein